MAAQDWDSSDNETTLLEKLTENIRVMAEGGGASDLEETVNDDNATTRLRKMVHNTYQLTQV